MRALKKINTEVAKELFLAIQNNSRALNTRLTNDQHLGEFQSVTGLINFPIPMDTAKGYLFALASKGSKFGTIKRKADSLHYAHKGSDSPFDGFEMKEFLKGLKNTMQSNDRKSVTVKHSKPISKDLLIRACDDLLRVNTSKSIRDRTMVILGFLGAFRISELINIRFSDLERSEDGYMIKLYESKNLNTGEVGEKWFPVSNSSLCPVRALDTYLETFSRADDDYLFNSFRRGDKEQSTPISKRAAQKLIKAIFGEQYSAHSLRSGFVTECFNQGATTSAVMQQTLHKSIAGLIPYDQTDKKNNNAVNTIIK